MTELVIPQKMSGTGTIHDLASQHYDRVIRFTGNAQYAVVLADYYGGKGYTTHKTERTAAAQARRVSDYSFQILDARGCFYEAVGDALYKLYI